MKKQSKLKLPIAVILFSATILISIQLKAPEGMLMLERFFNGGGWIEILILLCYGGTVSYYMQDKKLAPRWRIISWSTFTIFFFSQLILGILVSDKFLLTGKLHIPVPAMLISGPIYRDQLSVMTLLFVSTIVLTGPAWCSHLCYFGALDGLASSKIKGEKNELVQNLFLYKGIFIPVLIFTTLTLKWINFSTLFATIVGIGFGVTGLLIIIFLSRKKGKMVHCVVYCPIGTVVSVLKWISPFRLRIDKGSCTMCMHCTPECKYDALNLKNLQKNKPGLTCTLCGDCLSACKDNAIAYKLFQLHPETARNTYLFITVSLHVIFMAMGRI